LDWYDLLGFLWTFGYIVLESQLMFQLAQAVKNDAG
jgi:hypothetical protein